MVLWDEYYPLVFDWFDWFDWLDWFDSTAHHVTYCPH